MGGGDHVEDRREGHDEPGNGDDRQREGRATPVEDRVGDEHDHRDRGHDDLGIDGDDIGRRHLKATTMNDGSVARRMRRSTDGSIYAMNGCGTTPRITVSIRSGSAQAISSGERSGSALYACGTWRYMTPLIIQSRYTASGITRM